MREIKIFLASSSELQTDRKDFEIFINRKNKRWYKRDIFLRLELWEDFLDAMSADGLQSEYNKAAKNCDIFVMLVHNKVGKYTAEEFSQAFGQFSKMNTPFIYTYFKEPRTTQNRADIESLWVFEDKLTELKHYKNKYANIEGLREQFGDQLDKLVERDLLLSRPASVAGLKPSKRVAAQTVVSPQRLVISNLSESVEKKDVLSLLDRQENDLKASFREKYSGPEKLDR